MVRYLLSACVAAALGISLTTISSSSGHGSQPTTGAAVNPGGARARAVDAVGVRPNIVFLVCESTDGRTWTPGYTTHKTITQNGATMLP